MTTPSHSKLLLAGKDLFWNYGLAKVTVEDICKEAGVSKMTFYRLFNNKEDLAEKILDEMIQKGVVEYEAIMGSDSRFPDKVEKLIGLKYSQSKNMSSAFIKDLFDTNQRLAANLKAAQATQILRLRRDFDKAQREGWLHPDLSLDFIMYMLNDLNAKMKDENLLGMYTHPSSLIKQLTQFFFNGISNPAKEW